MKMGFSIEPDGFHQRGTVVINHRFPTFGNLVAQHPRQRIVDTLRPTAYDTSPPFYAFSLLRSALEFSFEIIAIRCSVSI